MCHTYLLMHGCRTMLRSPIWIRFRTPPMPTTIIADSVEQEAAARLLTGFRTSDTIATEKHVTRQDVQPYALTESFCDTTLKKPCAGQLQLCLVARDGTFTCSLMYSSTTDLHNLWQSCSSGEDQEQEERTTTQKSPPNMQSLSRGSAPRYWRTARHINESGNVIL